ncbi:MAG: hypothetical protein KBB64_07565 [Bacteroidia bacterium]|jgi:hypothetical protein|nr:hypothetical protein [Bacteroidia bacterium]
MKKFLIAGLCLLTVPLIAQQTEAVHAPSSDFTIPAAPAYQLLDANASLVGRASVTRDFKVDWSLKSYRLAPNLALEMQPVWLVTYNKNNDVSRYRKAGYLMRTLTTLSASAGTLDGNDSTRFFSYALKLNLYRSHDPLLDEQLYNDYQSSYEIALNTQRAELDSMLRERKKLESTPERDSLDANILRKENELYQFRKTFRDQLKQRQDEYRAKYWNASYVDIAWGRAFSFNPKLADRIDSLSLDNTGNAVWINASFGIGRRWLISGMFRTINKQGLLRTSAMDSLTGSPIITTSKKDLFDFATGLNIRYGSVRYSFFIEGFLTRNRNVAAILENGLDSGNDLLVTEERLILAYGGDLRLGNNVLLNYGIRTTVNKSLKFGGMVPIASVTCLMK